MSGGSLRVRLLLAGFGAVALALVVAWAALTAIFARHLERRAVAEAETHLRTLIAGAIAEGGTIRTVGQPADPAFAEPYGGLYWQVQRDGTVAARSRSLWDTELTLPQDDLTDGGVHVHDLAGPRGARLLAVERPLLLTSAAGPQRYRVIVAQDAREIETARAAFARDLALGLGLLALVLLAASIAQVGIGLRPLASIRQSLQAVRSGALSRLPGSFPSEVTPLAGEINALLDERDAAVARARGRAADLAHGLKTPLTALAANAKRLREVGQSATAEEIDNLGALMHRHVHRELARARIAAGAAASAGVPVRTVVDLIAAAVSRTPDAEAKTFDFDIDPDLIFPMDRADLEELLGNLVENGMRHARSTVRIRATRAPTPTLEVSDDGKGIAMADRSALIRRGERLDQSGPGAGLGLAIVSDIVEAYGATLALRTSDIGGLAAVITFQPS